jgi:hypothetical protein
MDDSFCFGDYSAGLIGRLEMTSLQLPSKKVHEVSDQSFGGEWTETKLKKVKSYYQRALKNQHFITWYVDAFAGTGSRTSPEVVDMSFSLLGDEVADEEEAARYRDGSAKIALQLPRPFDETQIAPRRSL